MRLQDLVTRKITLTPEGIKRDRELSTQIQTRLTALRLLDFKPDGNFGPQSLTAFKDFQVLKGMSYDGNLRPDVAEALIETKEAVPLKLGNDLASRIVKYAIAKNYFVPVGPKRYFLCYLEGCNADGSLNADQIDQWNDRRIVIEIPDGVPKIVANYLGSSEPGLFYTQNPLNREGAARIAFSQFKSWRVGTHKDHEALVQVADVKIHRDLDRNGSRQGDPVRVGCYGINQHWGGGSANVGKWSAGCLCGQSKQEHRQWMALIKQDRRYQVSKDYIYMTTVIDGADLLKASAR